MPELYYKDALKQGQKEYRACVSRGEYPYLPVLDELVPQERLLRGQNLGLVQVPLEFIMGTRSSARSSVFARNFMPLAPELSEFADKWQHLCQSHLEEGIRDPLKVYEYMNRFYVEEGNKRVSVLKYFDAITVPAQVTRVLPERSGSKEVALYFEFVDFYRVSRVNFLEFSRPGSFADFQRLLGKGPEEPWTDEDRSAFTTVYYYFRQAYESCGGKDLTSTVGDAMLAYMKVYGYQALRDKTAAEIKKSVAKVWEEITLLQEETPIELKLDPAEKKPGLLTKVLSGTDPKAMGVAFIHDKDPAASGWTKIHEQGREHVQRVFGDRIQTRAYFGAMDSDPLTVIEQAISDGCTTIFTTSPRLLPASLRAAVEHPEVTILNCSLNKSHRYIRTYYARMYEAKFIIGAMAGALAGDDPVGYLCDYPIFGQIAGINAFAQGVQMVNPTAKVYLEWSAVGGADAAMKRLTDRGIRLISSQDQTKLEDEDRESFGLSLFADGKQVTLALPVWQWGVYYEAVLRRIQNKSFQSEYTGSSKALNYYWGMSAGVVELRCTEKVPPSIKKLAELLQKAVRSGLCDPFQGPLYAQNGQVLGEGQSLTPEQIIRMDYLVENVVGDIPVYQELTDMAKATVDMVGVEKSTKDKRG